jgi:hypothetical protein
MAKTSGLPTSFTIDDSSGTPVTFSNDVATVNLDISQAIQDVSGLDSTGTERIGLRGDYKAAFTGFWGSADVISVFGDIRTARALTVAYPGRTFTGEIMIDSFADAIGADGSDSWAASGSSSDGAFPTFA